METWLCFSTFGSPGVLLAAPVVGVTGVETWLCFSTFGSAGVLPPAPAVGVVGVAGVETLLSLFSATCFCSGGFVVLVSSFDKAGYFGVAVSTTTVPLLLLGVVSAFFVSSIS